MELQVEKNEDEEKPLSKRRSSILKLPKPRNPFEEIETTATFTDINFSKPRRVSFASSNFVKPFVADPEKNTIWDTTYEEDVNHTNSTQSSQEQNANSCTKFGSTFFDSMTAKSVTSIVNATSLSQHDMDLTVFPIDKENIPIICPPKFSIIDYAKKLATNSVVPVFDLSANRSMTKNMDLTCQDSNFPHDVTTMEFSCQDLNEADVMELTCYVPEKNVTKLENDMEFTCQVPQTNINKSDIELTCQLKQSSVSKSNTDMTFTCQISGENLKKLESSKVSHKNMTSMEMTCRPKGNENLTDGSDMEVDTTLSKSNNNMTITAEPCQKKIVEEGDVEVEQISTTNQKNGISWSKNNTSQDSPKNLINEKIQCQINLSNIDKENLSTITKKEKSVEINNEDHNIHNMEISYQTAINEKENTPKKQTKFEEKENTPLPIITVENVESKKKSHLSIDYSTNIKETTPKLLDTSRIPSFISPTNSPTSTHMSIDYSTNIKETTPKPLNTTRIPSFISPNYWATPASQKLEIPNTPSTLSNRKKHMKSLFQMKDSDKLKTSQNISMLKHDLSALRTPEATLPLKSPGSFHFNLTNISSGIDDTEHLLHCNYSKPSFLLSRLEKSETQEMNLENTGHISKPNLTNISNLEETSSDLTIDDIQRNKLSNINDTYALRNKKNNINTDVDGSLDDDDSLGIIPDEDMQIEDEVEALIKTRSPKKIERKEYHYEIKRVSEIADLINNIENQRNHIINYLENIKFRKMRIPEEFTICEHSSLGTSESINESSSDTVFVTIEENVREHQKSCQKCWELQKVDDDWFHFSTLFGKLIFVVSLKLDTGIVTNIETESKLSDKSKPLARFILKLFKDKLNDHNLRSAIGHQYDIITLLDYVQMTMLRIQSFQREFMTCDNISMEKDFVVKYKILNVSLVLSFEIFVDVRNIETLNCDEAITIVTHIGTVNENEVKNLAKNCPKGLDFFKHFEQAIKEYLGIKEKRKNFSKGH